MLKYQTFVSLKRMLRVENAKYFLQQHRDQIKTVALPCLVLAAVLFFWFYGNAQDSEQVQMEDAQTAAENQPTETQQAELAGSETKGAENIPEQGDIYVDICGEVAKPDVYRVKNGSRLFEVIAQAGGLTAQADINVINRAETVRDGQKIRILSYEETNQGAQQQGDASASQYRSQAQANDRKININLADAATLQMIPGIGPSKAERILEYRETTGPFQNIEDIKNVSGIGNKTFENIREYLCVS